MAYHHGFNKYLPVIRNSLEQTLNGNFYWFESRSLLMENTGLSATLVKVRTKLSLALADVKTISSCFSYKTDSEFSKRLPSTSLHPRNGYSDSN